MQIGRQELSGLSAGIEQMCSDEKLKNSMQERRVPVQLKFGEKRI
jgi:hypothetical protein